jgi:L-ribulose-5-phosphate 4-epimerase
MLESLKQQVFKANISLVRHGLVIFTWGNASGLSAGRDLMVIKPSGVAYDDMTAEDMTVVDMAGNIVEGRYKPSSDTATHIEIYRAFPHACGAVHTHSTYATAWAQAGLDIPNIGTTHADYFKDDIPCTRAMTQLEIETDYEAATGRVIAERFEGMDPRHTPAVLVRNHGPFSWGSGVDEAVVHAVVMEQAAKMACIALGLNPRLEMNDQLIRKHFERKHGPKAYYGQANH